MAKVKFGLSVVGIRGTLGGTVFSANKSGPYAKTWAKGPTRRSSSICATRAFFSQAARNWASITDEQRDDWSAYGAAAQQNKIDSLGETYSASGFNWYIAVNSMRLDMGLSVLDDAPDGVPPTSPECTYSYFYDSPVDEILINWDTYDFADLYGRVYATLARGGANISPSVTTYRHIADIPLHGVAEFIIIEDLDLFFGQSAAGDLLFVKIIAVDTKGRVGSPSFFTAVAT